MIRLVSSATTVIVAKSTSESAPAAVTPDTTWMGNVNPIVRGRRKLRVPARVSLGLAITNMPSGLAVSDFTSADIGPFTEELAPGRFGEAMRPCDTVAYYNHDVSLRAPNMR